MRRWVLAALSSVIVHGTQAADLRGPFSNGFSTTLVNWQGFYIGGQGGFSSANMDMEPLTQLALSKESASSASFGGFVGYNAQWDDVVLGIEANYSHFSDLTGSSKNLLPGFAVNPTETVTNAPTLRGRAGWAVGSFMPYMFGGLAVGQVDLNGGVTTAPPPAQPDASKVAVGYTAGLGVDVILSGNIFGRAEYEYVQFTSSKLVDININTLRLGLGYKF